MNRRPLLEPLELRILPSITFYGPQQATVVEMPGVAIPSPEKALRAQLTSLLDVIKGERDYEHQVSQDAYALVRRLMLDGSAPRRLIEAKLSAWKAYGLYTTKKKDWEELSAVLAMGDDTLIADANGLFAGWTISSTYYQTQIEFERMQFADPMATLAQKVYARERIVQYRGHLEAQNDDLSGLKFAIQQAQMMSGR